MMNTARGWTALTLHIKSTAICSQKQYLALVKCCPKLNGESSNTNCHQWCFLMCLDVSDLWNICSVFINPSLESIHHNHVQIISISAAKNTPPLEGVWAPNITKWVLSDLKNFGHDGQHLFCVSFLGSLFWTQIYGFKNNHHSFRKSSNYMGHGP